MLTIAGAHNYDCSTSILSLCDGISTDRFLNFILTAYISSLKGQCQALSRGFRGFLTQTILEISGSQFN